MNYYKDAEKMLKGYAVMEKYSKPGIVSNLPIPLALADIFNKTGCACGAKYKPTDIKYTVEELEGEDGEYIVIEAKTICSKCNAFLKLTKYIQNKELMELKKKWTS
jgi:hypothetical protein